MERVRIFFKSNITPQYTSIVRRDQGESMFTEPKYHDTDLEQDSETTFFRSSQRQRPYASYATFVVLLALYSFLLVAFVNKRPSDRQCVEQLSVWCTLATPRSDMGGNYMLTIP